MNGHRYFLKLGTNVFMLSDTDYIGLCYTCNKKLPTEATCQKLWHPTAQLFADQ